MRSELRHAKIREQIAEELPDIKRRARERLALIRREGTPLRQALAALRAERERQGEDGVTVPRTAEVCRRLPSM